MNLKFNSYYRCWPEIDFNKKLLKTEVYQIASFARFVEKHVKCTTYSFQVKKCIDAECEFHSAIRLPREVFEEIKWLPTRSLSGISFYLSRKSTGKNRLIITFRARLCRQEPTKATQKRLSNWLTHGQGKLYDAQNVTFRDCFTLSIVSGRTRR